MGVSWNDAQAAVIGSALIDPSCVPLILAETRAEDYSGAFLRFYEALRDLSADRTPIDPVIVLSRIGQEYAALCSELIDRTPTAANVKTYVRICKEQSRLRLLREAGAELAEAETLEDARAILQRAAGVAVATAQRRTVTAMELAAAWINEINSNEKPDYILTGISCLDSLIHTVPGNYHVIAGGTSHGKSALALQIAWNMAQTRKVGYFSLEMPESDFRHRLITMAAPADRQHVQDRELTEEELRTTARAAGQIFKAKIGYEPASDMSVDDIRAVTLQQGYEVVFVDYLQNVQTPQLRQSDRYRSVTEISRGLQTLALSLGVVVFAMSQISRQDEDDGFVPVPALSSLRESGQIEQDADAVVFVHAPLRKAMPHFHVLDIAKNRSGPLGRFFTDFIPEHQRFQAPGVLDYKIWSETMHKRRMLKADERREIEAQHAAATPARELEAAARARRERKKNGEDEQQALPL